jgi:dipeptide/tripeptide permease
MDTWQAGGFGIFQSANPLFILIFAPLFAMLWPALEKKGVNPSIPRKFALGLIQVALGFLLLVFAINNFQNARVALIRCYWARILDHIVHKSI